MSMNAAPLLLLPRIPVPTQYAVTTERPKNLSNCSTPQARKKPTLGEQRHELMCQNVQPSNRVRSAELYTVRFALLHPSSVCLMDSSMSALSVLVWKPFSCTGFSIQCPDPIKHHFHQQGFLMVTRENHLRKSKRRLMKARTDGIRILVPIGRHAVATATEVLFKLGVGSECCSFTGPEL